MNDKLAIDGGRAVRSAPFPQWPYFDQNAISSVEAVLRSAKVNYWTGEVCKQFEKDFASYSGCRFGVALANGTVALELALRITDICPGDEVIVTPRSFIASASCVFSVGAVPVFADVDADSQALTAKTIEAAITKKTKAVILVHLGGRPADLGPILSVVKKHGLILIEDCAQAHGAKYRDQPVGSFGHVATFSFCQDKIITTGGEGGILVTNDENLWRKAWEFKDHGKSWALTQQPASNEGFRWLHQSYGTNFRMTEMQAAIGLAWLDKIESDIEKRSFNAKSLEATLSKFGAIRTTRNDPESRNSYYKLYAFVRPENLKSGWSRERIISAICAEGLPCSSGSCSEIYLEEAIPEQFKPEHRLPVAKELGETSLMFLVHPTITKEDLSHYQCAIEKVLSEASL